MKKIMILGAGRGQLDLIRAAKKYGYYSIVTSIEGNYPGFDEADECCYADISRPEEVLEAARRFNIDAIATACLDTGVSSIGYVCDKMGLSGLSEKAAKLSSDKLLMKSAFMENGVNTAKYKKVSSADELDSITKELNLPLIVKAVDLQGSRGINIVRKKEELLSAFEDTMNETKKDFCIIEEFIEGYEFGAQAFVVNGKVLYVLPCGDITYLSKTNIPVGHYAPLELDGELAKSVYEQSVKAIRAIGLNNCAVNIDMILKDGRVYLIELTGRVGANCLPQLSSIYFGIDVYKMIIDVALGNDPTEYFEKNKKDATCCYARMLYSEKSGRLKEIKNNAGNIDGITELTFFVKPGINIRKITSSRDCLGEIVVKGSSVKECEVIIEKALSEIDFITE